MFDINLSKFLLGKDEILFLVYNVISKVTKAFL